jgi:muconate cycloisomerase
MDIAKIDVVPFTLALREGQRMGTGRSAPTTCNVFVRITDRDGIVGYGEASSWSIFTAETPTGMCDVIRHHLAPVLLGRSPFETNALLADMNRAIIGNEASKAAVEMALWDLKARILNVSAAHLFGGVVRHSLGLSYSVSLQDPAQELHVAKELYAEGYRIFKIKVGVLNWRVDVARIEALAGLTGVTLRLDYNGLANPADLRKLVAALNGLPLDFIEQPFPAGDVALLRRMRPLIPYPICVDEGCIKPGDLVQLCELEACDIISLKLAKVGGHTAGRNLAAIAAAWGIHCYAGAYSETRLGTTAALHLLLTLPHLVDGCDYYYPLRILADDPCVGGFVVENGRIRLPDGPGFGVELPRRLFGD